MNFRRFITFHRWVGSRDRDVAGRSEMRFGDSGAPLHRHRSRTALKTAHTRRSRPADVLDTDCPPCQCARLPTLPLCSRKRDPGCARCTSSTETGADPCGDPHVPHTKTVFTFNLSAASPAAGSKSKSCSDPLVVCCSRAMMPGARSCEVCDCQHAGHSRAA